MADAKLVEDAFEQKLAGLLPAEPAAQDAASVSIHGAQNTAPTNSIDPLQSTRIDKSTLALGVPRRYRNKDHLRFVTQQPCLLCGRKPSDAHHIRFVQPRALGRKTSDEFAVPLCRVHHRALHRVGDERAWWKRAGIDPVKVARNLWKGSRVYEGRVGPNPTAQAAALVPTLASGGDATGPSSHPIDGQGPV